MSIVDDFRMPDSEQLLADDILCGIDADKLSRMEWDTAVLGLSWANMPGAIVLPELPKDWTMADVRRLVEELLASSPTPAIRLSTDC